MLKDKHFTIMLKMLAHLEFGGSNTHKKGHVYLWEPKRPVAGC